MLKGESILCFAPGPWDTIWRNRHHIMSRLARHNRVLYVEPIPYLRPSLRRFRKGQLGPRELLQRRSDHVLDGLFVYHPHPLLPICGRAPLSVLTNALRRRLLKREMEKLGMRDPILWLFRPEMHYLIGQFGEKLCVYHVVDEYTGYQGVDQSLRNFLRQAELELLSKAGLVLVVSENLYKARAPLNPHTFVVPNGVDHDAFVEARRNDDRPEDMLPIRPPILGYIGLISVRLNLSCLRRLVTDLPHCSLVLLGSIDPLGVDDQLRDLLACPRVYFLGRKPPQELPGYLTRFDVCLIPYRMGEETMSADPLKVYEYLAAGKPVVATSIPSLQRFSPVLKLASTDDGFFQSVTDALSGEDPSLPSRRMILAQENNWEDRVERISQLIQSRLGATPGLCLAP